MYKRKVACLEETVFKAARAMCHYLSVLHLSVVFSARKGACVSETLACGRFFALGGLVCYIVLR